MYLNIDIEVSMCELDVNLLQQLSVGLSSSVTNVTYLSRFTGGFQPTWYLHQWQQQFDKDDTLICLHLYTAVNRFYCLYILLFF